MSYSKLFLLGVGLALFHVESWKGTAVVVLYLTISTLETWNRDRRLKKILDNEFHDGWIEDECEPTIEVKDGIARLKIDGDKDNAMLVRIAQIMYRMAVVEPRG